MPPKCTLIMPNLKLYTVAQLRQWLIHNCVIEGLSEQIIAPNRAWAIINNPFVQENDYVLAAIFVDGEVAAYTAAFPEILSQPLYKDEKGGDGRIWWFSTLWCAPKHQGKGFGLIVVGSLAEQYGEGRYFDRWGAEETVELFQCLGLQTVYTPRYCLCDGTVNKSTLHGKLAFAKQEVFKWWHNRSLKPTGSRYTLRYLSHIDDATYGFIQNNCKQDLFLHAQDMLNWELRFPFSVSSPVINHVKRDTSFSSYVVNVQYYAVQVWNSDDLVGFYLLKYGERSLCVKYLYYRETDKESVFNSILDHVVLLQIEHFETENKDLASFIQLYVFFPKNRIISVSLSYPESFLLRSEFTTQYGDGDSFA